MRFARGTGALALGVTVTLVGAGCVWRNTDPDADVIAAGDVYVLMETEEYHGATGGQSFMGTLALVGECVGVDDRRGGTLIVFPPDTSVTGTGTDLVISVADHEIRLGDTVEAGTRLNESGRAELSSFGDLAEQAPESCRGKKATPINFED